MSHQPTNFEGFAAAVGDDVQAILAALLTKITAVSVEDVTAPASFTKAMVITFEGQRYALYMAPLGLVSDENNDIFPYTLPFALE